MELNVSSKATAPYSAILHFCLPPPVHPCPCSPPVEEFRGRGKMGQGRRVMVGAKTQGRLMAVIGGGNQPRADGMEQRSPLA